MQIVIEFLKATIDLWLEVSPYLILGMVFASLLHVFLGKDLISKQLGTGGLKSIVKASLFGVPLPVCSCGVIPLATSLRKDGAHKSSVLSFLVSTPTTGVDSILATYALLGPLFAVFRPLGAFIAGITLGITDLIFEGKNEVTKPIPTHPHPKMSLALRLREFFRYFFSELPQDIGKWLIIGTIVGGAITVLLPVKLFSQYLSFPFDFLAALIIGVPLYVCATGSIPIAASLIAKGFSPGAALVFLIVGPATNAITLSFVRVKLGKKSFYLYLASIVSVAAILGIIFNYLWAGLGKDPSFITGAGKMLPLEYKIASGVILFLLIILSFFKRSSQHHTKTADMVIPITDIKCRHCKITLEAACRGVKGLKHIYVDIANKEIRITGKVERSEIIAKIKQAGYTPEK